MEIDPGLVLPETWIQVVGIAVIVLGPTVAQRVFRAGEKKTTQAGEQAYMVEQAVRASVDLGPTVATLNSAVTTLQEETAKLKAQLAKMRPVVEVKYPAALDTVAAFKDAHPTSQVEIAPEIIEDLSKR